MKNDIEFLFRSDFTKILNFSEVLDPLLIIPSKPIDKKGLKTYEFQKFLSIPTMLLKRVKLAEQYILDEDRDPLINKSNSGTALENTRKINRKAGKRILEELIEENCEKELTNFATKIVLEERKTLNNAAAKKVRGGIIKEVSFNFAKEIAMQVYHEALDGPIKKHIGDITTKYIEEETEKIVREIIKEERMHAKESMKESAKNELKSKKEKEKSDKKRKEEELALEKKLAREKEENEKNEKKLAREKEENEKKIAREKEENERKRAREIEENEKKQKAEQALKKKIDEENYQIAKLILESLLRDLHVDIEILASNLYKEEVDLSNLGHSQKAYKLMLNQIAEQIHRIMIDEEIDAINLNGLAEEQLNQEIEEMKAKNQSEMERKMLEDRERSLQNDRISELIYFDLFDELLVKLKFNKIPEKMIETVANYRNSLVLNISLTKSVTYDPDDYAVDEFTPGEHSPKLYGIDEENKLDESPPLISPRKNEDIIYEFANDGEFQDANDIQWIPIYVDERNVEEIIGEYYSCLSSNILSVMPNISQLFLEIYKGIDPC